MVKLTQTIRRLLLLPTNCLIVFDLFVGLAFKGLMNHNGVTLNMSQYGVTLHFLIYGKNF